MKESPSTITPTEMMILTAAKEIKDRELVFVGTYWPIVTAALAKRTCAPNSLFLFEGGILCDSLPLRTPLLTTDPSLVGTATLCGDSIESLVFLQGGDVDVGLLSANSVDKFGNVNSTCIGDYLKPNVRLAGSGGANDVMSLSKRVVVIMEHERRRFPERVDYVTSPGFLNGGPPRIAREEAGLRPDTGPCAVVTTKGIFRFDKDTGEMVLDRYYPGTSIEEIAGTVGWKLKVSDTAREIEVPKEKELRILRQEIDPARVFLKQIRA